MQETESLQQTFETLRELVSGELKNCNTSDDFARLTIGKSGENPNFVMNERHKMVRNRLNPLRVKLFPTPSELKFVSAKKAIRDENSKILLREKEKRFVARAVTQLEREFYIRRSNASLSLPELEKHRKEGIHSGMAFRDKKSVGSYNDPGNFLKDIQKTCDKLHRTLSHFQFCEKPILEKERITLSAKRSENFEKLSPVTPNTDRRNKSFVKLSPVTPPGKDGSLEKIEKEESKLNTTDRCQRGKNITETTERSEVEIPNDNRNEKMNNEADEPCKWKMLYYWKVWRKVTVEAKKENRKLERIKKIDSFLMRLTKAAEQAQQLEKLANSISSQNTEMKPPKLLRKRKSRNESEESPRLDEIQKELTEAALEAYERLNKGLKMYHPKLQPKLKALSVLSIIKNKHKKDIRRVYPTPIFLTEMENRHKERKTRWENIRKRRLEMEAEKERIIKEQEEEEKKMEDLKKREKLEELKEKRRREKEAEEERKRERWLLKQQLKLAHDHYKRYLMKKVGFQSLQRLARLRKSQMESAHYHSQIRICREYLKQWRLFTINQLNEKNKKAQELYEKILKNKFLHTWMLFHAEYVQKIQVAVDWSEAKLAEKLFAVWFDNAQAEHWYFSRKLEYAQSFYDRKILLKCLKKWENFPELMRNEKEKERRKKLWQRKVQELLPDYQPAFVSEI